jgi:hypothetical protein
MGLSGFTERSKDDLATSSNVARSHRAARPIALRASAILTICFSYLVICGFSHTVTSHAGLSGRKFTQEITGPFTVPGGIAADGNGNVWVADTPQPGTLDEFDSSSKFQTAIALAESATEPTSIAVDESLGALLVTGPRRNGFPEPLIEAFDSSGKALSSWKNALIFGPPTNVAADNAAGVVYLAHGEPDPSIGGDGLPAGIEKLNASGEPSEFQYSKTCAEEACGYLSGNEITGIPGSSFQEAGAPLSPTGVAVGPSSELFAVDRAYNAKEPTKPEGAIVEFDSNGKYLTACTGEENPGFGEEHIGWGVLPEGIRAVAVDPTSTLGHVHVLVLVRRIETGEGAIDEFEVEGTGSGAKCRYLGQIVDGPVNGRLTSAVQLLAFSSNGTLYVVERSGSPHRDAVDVYEVRHFPPVVALSQAPAVSESEATVAGTVTVDEEGPALSSCHFEYTRESEYNQEGFSKAASSECVPVASAIPADSSPHSVSATLAGLESGTTYRYRLSAGTEGSLGETAVTGSLALTALAAPGVDSSEATNISSQFAELRAGISPLGANTTYRFEYDTREYVGDEAHGVSVPLPDGGLGRGGFTGGAEVDVAQAIGGLSPSTRYFFRVVATNAVGVTMGAWCGGELRPGCSFETLPVPDRGLADARGYELLTPANKGSAEDLFAHNSAIKNLFLNSDRGYPSLSGRELLFETKAAFGAFPASAQNGYVFRRDPGGWSMSSVASPSLGVQSVVFGVFGPESFERLGVQDETGSTPDPAGVTRVGLLGPPGGGADGSEYKTVVSQPVSGFLKKPGTLVGASRDLTHVVTEVQDPSLLAPGQHPGSSALYEWLEGKPTLLSIGVDGLPLECGAQLGQSTVISGATHGAVTADGAKVFFTAPDPYAVDPNGGEGCWHKATGENVPQLYMRRGGVTTAISMPEEGVVEAGSSEPGGVPVRRPAIFVGASEDGSRVFFVTRTELTEEAAELKLHDPELYEYDTDSGSLRRLSAGDGPGVAGDVLTVPAMSPDGSTVYFTAFGDLAPGGQALSDVEASFGGPVGPVNLYRYDMSQGTTTFVARVAEHDYPAEPKNGWWDNAGKPIALETSANWYITPDGRYLLFATTGKLSGYDPTAREASDCPVVDITDVGSTQCMEVYRYDSQQPLSEGQAGTPDNPLCVSCDPSGEKPVSEAFFGHSAGLGIADGSPVRGITENGACAFFATADPLVPQDGNGTLDVYEWEAQGAARCETEQPPGASPCQLQQGCLHLISSGTDAVPSYFLGASADGSDVFFGTHTRLVPRDTDNAGDIYDARIGGGEQTPAGVGPCEGDACANVPPSTIDTTPGSFSFTGSENVVPSAKAPVAGKRSGGSSAQKLAKALKACRHKAHKSARKRCEASARKRYLGAKKTNVRSSPRRIARRMHSSSASEGIGR